MKRQDSFRKRLCIAFVMPVALAQVMLVHPSTASAQTAAAPAAAPAKPPLKQEELEQILAPVALYPDSLLSQIFMASTYPLEIVQADRWTKEKKDLKGDALATELENQPWDPSVKSLVNFPQILSMMSEKLDVTVKLGDAFIADQKSVMDTVQKLRATAQAQGNLKTTSEQKVVVQQVPSTTTQVIVIEPVNPQVIYVPVYSPTLVYGPWPYPAYPPYPYYPPPPAYYVPSAAIGFAVGMTIGVAWGYAWGGCNWGHSSVNVNVHRNVNINNNHINYNKYQTEINRRNTNIGSVNNNSFQHNPAHRQGVAYRDQSTAQKFGGVSSAQATQARQAYRGRTDSGFGGSSAGGFQNRSAGNNWSGSLNRSSAGARSSAFGGGDFSGGAARSASQRGQTSRSQGRAGGSGGRR